LNTVTIVEDKKIKELKRIIARYPKGQDDLIEVLHGAQELYGYLPREVMIEVSRELEVPLSTINGVATFYHLFSLTPPPEHEIKVCMGTACYVKGGKLVAEALQEILKVKPGETTPDGKFRFSAARCLGACGLAPVMMIDNKDVYARLTPKKVKAILDTYE